MGGVPVVDNPGWLLLQDSSHVPPKQRRQWLQDAADRLFRSLHPVRAPGAPLEGAGAAPTIDLVSGRQREAAEACLGMGRVVCAFGCTVRVLPARWEWSVLHVRVGRRCSEYRRVRTGTCTHKTKLTCCSLTCTWGTLLLAQSTQHGPSCRITLSHAMHTRTCLIHAGAHRHRSSPTSATTPCWTSTLTTP